MSDKIAVTFLFLPFFFLWLPFYAEGLKCYHCLDIQSGPCFEATDVGEGIDTDKTGIEIVDCQSGKRCYALLAKVAMTTVQGIERGCELPENDICQELLPKKWRNVVKCSTCDNDYCNSSDRKTPGDVRLALFVPLFFSLIG